MTPGVRSVARGCVWLAVAALAATFVLFVWPTRYRYDRVQLLGETAPGPVFPVRIDRVTGTAEILLPQMLLDSRHNMQFAWVGSTGDPLPETVLAELRQNVLIETEPLPFAQILNTTRWRITKVRWDVISPAGDRDSPKGAPRQLDQSVFIEPNSLASLYLDLGRFGHGASITFRAAWGVRVPDR
jgi:hypothetical protein